MAKIEIKTVYVLKHEYFNFNDNRIFLLSKMEWVDAILYKLKIDVRGKYKIVNNSIMVCENYINEIVN